jgi:thiol:disulfide interchange protein DsbC
VASTPTIFFADGKRMLGAYPAAEIEKALVTGKK